MAIPAKAQHSKLKEMQEDDQHFSSKIGHFFIFDIK